MRNPEKTKTNISKAFWRIGGVTLFLLATALTYHLLWGRLFPWSPLKLGYRQVAFAKALVVLPKDWSLPAELETIDNVLMDCEQFHGLSFKKTVMVILAKTPEDAHRLGMDTHAVGGSLQIGTVIILAPTRIQAKNRRLVDQLKHECSHAILYQNTSIRKSLRIPEWLREGLAIYYGNPCDNYVGESFLKLAVGDSYFFDVLGPYDTLKKVPEQFRYGFMHSEFRSFIEFLADRHSIKMVIAYTKDLIQSPASERPLFQKNFGENLDDAAAEFQQAVLARKWPRKAR